MSVDATTIYMELLIQEKGSANSNNTPNLGDDNQTGDFIDGLWEQMDILTAHGQGLNLSDGNISTLIQLVNDFEGLPPSPVRDPQAYQIYQEINSPGFGPNGESLCQLCQSENRYAIMEGLNANFSSGKGLTGFWKTLMDSLSSWPGGTYTHQDPPPEPLTPGGPNVSFSDLLAMLENDLSGGPITSANLAKVAQEMQAIMTSLSALRATSPPNCLDGYLRPLYDFLWNAHNGGPCLGDLVTAYEKNPSDPTAQKNLLNALTQTDSAAPSYAQGNMQNALADLLYETLKEKW